MTRSFLEKISKNYKINAEVDQTENPDENSYGPGKALMKKIRNWEHYSREKRVK